MINLFELSKSAILTLRANKARSFLTMLGVIIGVFSVITLIALGNGIQGYITNSFNNLGSNLIFVSPGKVQFNDDPAKAFSRNKLSEKHVSLIEDYAMDNLVAVTPSVRLSALAEFKTKNMRVSLIGGNYSAPDIFNYEAESGRFFTREEVRSQAKVAVIGQLVKEELFGAQDPLNQKIKINDETFEIIGVAKSRGRQLDDSLVMPYTTAMDLFDVKNFSSIAMKVNSTDNVLIAIKEVQYALLRDLKQDDFTVLSQADILDSINNILGILTAGLGAIAGISLFVGGIGIMNIMLVAVNERIREIGLRKAVGATPIIIGVQFMLESLFISVMGGMIGLFLGWLFSIGVRSFISISVSVWSILFAFGFSIVVGVVFGTYPAYRASKLDPIEALRHE